MVETITPKMLMTKPEIGASANAWGNMLNGNLDIIDNGVVRLTKQWKIIPGDDTAGSAAGPFQIKRYNNSEVEAGIPVSINRQDGNVTLQNNLTVNGSITGSGGLSGNASLGNVSASGTLSVTGTSTLGTLNAGTTGLGNTTTGALTTSGAISSGGNNITSSGTISGGNVNATTHGGTTVAVSGAISGNTITANGGTINGSLSAQGLSVSPNGISSNGSISTATNIHLNAGNAIYFEGTNARSLNWTGDDHFNFNGAHVYSSAGRLWGTNDWNYVPAHSSHVVNNLRWEHAGSGSGFGGGSPSFRVSNAVGYVFQIGGPTPELHVDFARLQGHTSDWFTVGGI